nr:MAG: replication associated protein [Cressdnaviricota sp.]
MGKKTPENPTESVGNGNTIHSPAPSKKESQAKHWCFTFNNYDKDDFYLIQERLALTSAKFIVGKEVGESGTPHLQGYTEFHVKKNLTFLKRNFNEKIHWEICRNIKASIEYCKKDNDYRSHGFPQPIKIITELRPWQKKIEDICLGEIDDRHIRWYYEPTGNFGKSAFCKYMFVKHNALLVKGGKLADIAYIIINSDMSKVKTFIIDIPRGHKNNVSYTAIECILDGYMTSTKFKSESKAFNPPNVIVFSNFEPDLSSDDLSKDRWIIKNLREEVILDNTQFNITLYMD